MDDVAVIGAGPGGLAVARDLASEGLVPVLFEQGRGIGGQWSGEMAEARAFGCVTSGELTAEQRTQIGMLASVSTDRALLALAMHA